MKRAKRLLPKTTRNLDDLAELLDGPIINQPMPTARPLRPSQVDKLVTKSFNAVLSQLHLLRLELLQKHSQINGLRDYSIALLEKQKSRSKKVIDPRTITVPRSIKVFDQHLQFIEDLFQEVMQLHERHLGKPWIAKGTVK